MAVDLKVNLHERELVSTYVELHLYMSTRQTPAQIYTRVQKNLLAGAAVGKVYPLKRERLKPEKQLSEKCAFGECLC